MAQLPRLIIGLILLALLWPACFACSQSSPPAFAGAGSFALPIISAPPPPGYAYVVISTLDQNTGRVVWIVMLKPTFWSDWGHSVVGTLTTAVVGLLGWFFKSEIAQMFFPKVGPQ